MPRLITAAAIATSFAARYPNAGAATLDSLAASAEVPAQLGSVQAMAFKGLGATAKTIYVKAKELFFVAIGEHAAIGDVVEMAEQDAMDVVRAGRASIATDEEVAAAQKTAQEAGK